MGKYETNLASEFYVLSTLHRLGADASLTLGNKKSVDIVVVRKAGDAVTVDVKGVPVTSGLNMDYTHPSEHLRGDSAPAPCPFTELL